MQTEKQVRRQILNQTAPDLDAMEVLQAMSEFESRQHRTMAASLASWFQKERLQTNAEQSCAGTHPLCISDPPQQQVQLGRTASAVCDAAAPVCRNNSSDVSAMTTCLATTTFEQSTVASDVAEQGGKHGLDHVLSNTGMRGPSDPAPEGTGQERAPVTLTRGITLDECAYARDSGPCAADARAPGAIWMGASAHECPNVLDDDNFFEGLGVLDGSIEEMDDGIDVRSLWAGGDSLEAWSDCTMSEELEFVDSESVTGAILDCFKDPIWRFHEPPDEVPVASTTSVPLPSAPVAQPLHVATTAGSVEVAAVRQSYQESAVDFLMDAPDSADEGQPYASWKDPDYTPGALQVLEKSSRPQRKGTAKNLSGA